MTTPLTFTSTKKLIDTKDYRIQINEAGSGHPVFMIHGTGPGATGWSNFAPNIQTLSGKYRCIAVTMPGWGESSPQSLETGRDQVRAMVQLMDAMGIDRAAFVGNSMGGMISLQMTAQYPERVTHLITMGSGTGVGAGIFTAGGLSEGMRVLVEAYTDPSPENFKRLVQVMCYDSSNATDELAEQRSKAAWEFPEHNKNWLDLWHSGQAWAGWGDITPTLQRSTVPTLAIHGRDDRTVHFEASLRTVSAIPNSRMVLLNRCGHWAQLEHADEFNRLVDDFITNN
ncbi:alpha/beta fold hydrolase [Geodermatophilus ruber]|uniref:2-hydroxy-6-oxonona-2,4-dienedioate hydrolase n=1 Tax=Geodermatophilus ruber TaxID=504800 RepID=A0A1I4GKB8_9ACTN|nr:alpha/beta hydrolase [Geodermatophilus ruber]SFL29621.1 2-hydroxy-6-oxonona-2,4-dienedioate hydrolase [Geodermatophilus ruber]